MSKRSAALVFGLLVLSFSRGAAQQTPWYPWTLLPPEVMDQIIGEASGETAWNTLAAATPFERDRLAAEYKGTFWEAQYVLDQLRLYGIPGAAIERFPGGQTWDGVKGDLWEVSPLRQKLSSYQDLRAMLASGSTDTDVTAPLVWVGMGTQGELERAGVSGKIVVTEGSISSVHRLACQMMGALGVVSVANGRPFFDPLQIPNSGISGRGADAGPAKFGFFIPPREAEVLKQRLLAGEAITVHAEVEAATETYEQQDPVAHIPGTDPQAGEVVLSAHLFEGYVKQGANDNMSGSATILEVARTLHALIESGRIPRPKRTIRFLWGPEFSGTGPWVTAHKDLMEKTLANINMDMVGEWLIKNKSYMTLVRTTYGNPHYINDVMENYYRFVGEGNREQIANRSGFYKLTRRIVAPTGSDEPFYYSVDTHYGASDHEVFNDWGVQVPGIMMIAWPDQWYHTSGDRADKADPTQLKRVAVIGAAGAYTLAVADDEMALKIAGETASNATRRLGHQLVMGLEKLNNAAAENLEASYRWARALVEGAAIAEKATLESVNELAADKARVGAFVKAMQTTVDQVAAAHLGALDARMSTVAATLKVRPVRLAQTDLERRAARTIPRPTALVKANGYQGWRAPLQAVSADVLARFPTEGVASTAELQLLVNGRNSVLDIKKMLDAQMRTTSDLQAIFNHLEILKAAGLVEM
ncbi:MAG TPA: M28 family peptidase [Longimicrobiales bacterium]|nr:M28 family peptidase [Longimicrobiales bacterium]